VTAQAESYLCLQQRGQLHDCSMKPSASSKYLIPAVRESGGEGAVPRARVLQVPAMATEEGFSLFSKVITCGRGGMRRECKRLQRAAGRRIEGLQS